MKNIAANYQIEVFCVDTYRESRNNTVEECFLSPSTYILWESGALG